MNRKEAPQVAASVARAISTFIRRVMGVNPFRVLVYPHTAQEDDFSASLGVYFPARCHSARAVGSN
jgi:hypothetical protein